MGKPLIFYYSHSVMLCVCRRTPRLERLWAGCPEQDRGTGGAGRETGDEVLRGRVCKDLTCHMKMTI